MIINIDKYRYLESEFRAFLSRKNCFHPENKNKRIQGQTKCQNTPKPNLTISNQS